MSTLRCRGAYGEAIEREDTGDGCQQSDAILGGDGDTSQSTRRFDEYVNTATAEQLLLCGSELRGV